MHLSSLLEWLSLSRESFGFMLTHGMEKNQQAKHQGELDYENIEIDERLNEELFKANSTLRRNKNDNWITIGKGYP